MRALIIAACCCGFLISSGLLQAQEGGRQAPAKFSRSLNVEMEYLLSLPENYEQEEKWPLILFLHGAGERGNDLEKVKVHGPPKLIAAGQKFPFIVVSPQCAKDRWWQAVELSLLLDEIVEKYQVDEDRIYVTGLSMGGFGTWSLVQHAPHRFAAIAPICGGGDRQFVKQYKHVPIWIFHGAKDRAVPVERSLEMADALKKQQASPKLTIYPNAEHDSWTETYNNPELYTWFLSHRRVAKEE